jgi:hypothetical protein
MTADDPVFEAWKSVWLAQPWSHASVGIMTAEQKAEIPEWALRRIYELEIAKGGE